MKILLLLLAGFMSGEAASTTQIQSSSAGHAKQLVQAQFGPSVTVLSVKEVD